MQPPMNQVWVTLMGGRVHATARCQGLLDGHEKARSAGRPNYPPELWPTNLALRGWPRVPEIRRQSCAICLPVGLQAAAIDDPALVAAAKSGPIARAFLARRTERWSESGEDPSGEEYRDAEVQEDLDNERELLQEAYTPWDADHTLDY